MATPEEMSKYIEIEKEDHETTWEWLVAYVAENGSLPPEDTFMGMLVVDELACDPEAYEDDTEADDKKEKTISQLILED